MAILNEINVIKKITYHIRRKAQSVRGPGQGDVGYMQPKHRNNFLYCSREHILHRENTQRTHPRRHVNAPSRLRSLSRVNTPLYMCVCVCVCVCMYKYVYLTSAEPQNSSRSRSTLAPTSCNDVYLMSEFILVCGANGYPRSCMLQ